MNDQPKRPSLAHASGTPVTDNFNIQTAGSRGPTSLQDVWLIEKLVHFAAREANRCASWNSIAIRTKPRRALNFIFGKRERS